MDDIPFNDVMIPEQGCMPKAAQCEETKRIKLAFNQWVQTLCTTFQTEVDNIAQEFSRQGYHHSCHQIQKQVLYCVGMQKKPHKPVIHNAWAQAEALTEKIGSKCTLTNSVKVSKNIFPSGCLPIIALLTRIHQFVGGHQSTWVTWWGALPKTPPPRCISQMGTPGGQEEYYFTWVEFAVYVRSCEERYNHFGEHKSPNVWIKLTDYRLKEHMSLAVLK